MKTLRIPGLALLLAFATSCNRDNDIEADILKPEIELTGCDDSGTYYVRPGESLTIEPHYRNADGADFAWTLDGAVVCREAAWTATWPETGLFTVSLEVSNSAGTARETVYVSVQPLTPPVISLPRPEGGLRVEAGCELRLRPQFRFDRLEPFAVRWFVDGREEATGRELVFRREATGDYRVRIEASNADGTTSLDFVVSVVESMLAVGFPPDLLLGGAAGRHAAEGMPVSVVPSVSGFISPRYSWSVDGVAVDRALPVLVFTPPRRGMCRVELTVSETEGRNRGRSATAATDICVVAAPARRAATAMSSAHMSGVPEYMPAPGQFVDESGRLGNAGHDEACRLALKAMQAGEYVSLGAYGGYIVVCFDHSIPAIAGKDFDLAVGGNSFLASRGSSNEPGTVWVAQDVNANGVPDDEWYCLRGSDTDVSEPWRMWLDVTYLRPDAERTDVPWTASDGGSGTVDYLPEYHDQPSYYPAWAPAGYTLRGYSLPARNRPDGSTWALEPAAWGYADNVGSDVLRLDGEGFAGGNYTGLRLANAMAADGTPVDLQFVDFVMVRSATVGKSGWLGEISTEVTDFADYSMGVK